MLARANRLVRGDDYKAVVRRGVKVVGPSTITYVRVSQDHTSVRFGVITAKTVGTAVVRNRVRRRLKAVCFALTSSIPAGSDVVIRALPASAHASWASLQSEVIHGVSKGRDRTG